MTLEIFLQTVLVIIGVCGAIYGMMNFLLKDIYSRLILIDQKIGLIDTHISEIKDDHKKMDERVTETNRRMDGIYYVLLKKNSLEEEN